MGPRKLNAKADPRKALVELPVVAPQTPAGRSARARSRPKFSSPNFSNFRPMRGAPAMLDILLETSEGSSHCPPVGDGTATPAELDQKNAQNGSPRRNCRSRDSYSIWPRLSVDLSPVCGICSSAGFLHSPRTGAKYLLRDHQLLLACDGRGDHHTKCGSEQAGHPSVLVFFLAAACWAWALPPCVWFYYTVLHGTVPRFLLMTFPWFLHIVLMIAAMAARPHLRPRVQKPYAVTLDFLMVLFLLVFS